MTAEDIRLSQKDTIDAIKSAMAFFLVTNDISIDDVENSTQRNAVKDLRFEEISSSKGKDDEGNDINILDVVISYKLAEENNVDADNSLADLYKNRRYFKIIRVNKATKEILSVNDPQ